MTCLSILAESPVLVASGAANGVVTITDGDSGEKLDLAPHSGEVQSLCWRRLSDSGAADDQASVLVSGASDGRLRVARIWYAAETPSACSPMNCAPVSLSIAC